MKKLTAGQIQNIVFTVIVALAAVALYLLSGRAAPFSEGKASTADQLAVPTASALAWAAPSPERLETETAAPQSEPAPTAAPAPGAEEAAFLGLLSERLDVRAVSERAGSMRVSEPGERTVYAELFYSVRDGSVLGWTLRMEYPEKPVVQNKKSAIEQALLDSYMALLPRRNSALKTLLPLLTKACGAEQTVPGVVALEWYDGALSAAAAGVRYEAERTDCVFCAYVSMEGTVRTLVCTFLFS